MQTFSAFLSMNGYGVYVWPAFAASFGIMGLLLLASLRRLRHMERVLETLRNSPASPKRR